MSDALDDVKRWAEAARHVEALDKRIVELECNKARLDKLEAVGWIEVYNQNGAVEFDWFSEDLLDDSFRQAIDEWEVPHHVHRGETDMSVHTNCVCGCGDPAVDEFDPPLDPGIAAAVSVLRAAGLETFESCEGGAGHAYPEPTVRFHGERAAGFEALGAAMRAGLAVSALRRVWPVIEVEPTGPWWEMTFAPTKATSGDLAPTTPEESDA